MSLLERKRVSGDRGTHELEGRGNVERLIVPGHRCGVAGLRIVPVAARWRGAGPESGLGAAALWPLAVLEVMLV